MIIENDFIQAEILALDEQIALLSNSNEGRTYTVRPRLNPFDTYDDEGFRRRFRLTRNSVRILYELIGEQLEPRVFRENFTISGMDKLLITLRYYATACFQIVTADFYSVSVSSVCNIVPVVSAKIAELSPQFIQMSASNDEIEKAKREFFKIAGMPSVIGAIDGTLIRIQEVGGAQNKTDFFCRKQFYAINAQVVCDANCNIIDIVARWPGSAHDETVFLNSAIFERFLNGEFIHNDRISLLLGDGGYRKEVFLAVPLRETQRQRTPAEILYQHAHIATRNTIERLFGQWKKRFPCLWVGMRFSKVETVLSVIQATAVLHNLCKKNGDLLPPQLSPAEEDIYNAAIQQENLFLEENNRQRVQPATIGHALLRNYFERIATQQ